MPSPRIQDGRNFALSCLVTMCTDTLEQSPPWPWSPRGPLTTTFTIFPVSTNYSHYSSFPQTSICIPHSVKQRQGIVHHWESTGGHSPCPDLEVQCFGTHSSAETGRGRSASNANRYHCEYSMHWGNVAQSNTHSDSDSNQSTQHQNQCELPMTTAVVAQQQHELSATVTNVNICLVGPKPGAELKLTNPSSTDQLNTQVTVERRFIQFWPSWERDSQVLIYL
jgi:hypothetical protein